jgi:hypothetical protein
MSPGARERRPGEERRDDLACGGITDDSTAPPPKMRELTHAITALLHDMPGMGSSQYERDAWTLRKELLLADIEAATK